jgi:protein-S-isoprenylcysteine O-methyltransferase Ste14
VLFLKNLIFTVLVPGTVAVFVPYRLLVSSRRFQQADFGLRWLGLVPILFGVVLYLWCIWNFGAVGRGTPAPIDPPKTLVISGPFKYSRNPFYIAVLAVIFGQSWFFASRRVFLYGLLVWGAFHLFVRLYEEPTLSRLFGPSFERYCSTVPRWFSLKSRSWLTPNPRP